MIFQGCTRFFFVYCHSNARPACLFLCTCSHQGCKFTAS